MIESKRWRGAVRMTLAALLAAGCAACSSPEDDTKRKSQDKRKTPAAQLILDDVPVRLYVEAIAQIQQSAVFIAKTDDSNSIVEETLKAYLAAKDPFSDFLSHSEYLQIKKTREQQYVGIGMEIEKNRDGEVICFPYAEGPAAKAGIEVGDRVIAINGTPVRGKSLPTLSVMTLGEAGSQVVVEIAKNDGTRRRLGVTRSIISSKTIFKDSSGSMPVIRLLAFTPDTRQQLDYLISNWSDTEPLILDLRGSSGGDLHGAIDAAMLFLRKGEQIVSVRGKTGTKSYSSTVNRSPPKQPVFLWQDQATASASEVFVAALTENSRGVSIGQRTFGKGTRQDIIELSNGAALILTAGYLRTPRGNEFDGRGLDPNHAIKGDSSRTSAYFDKTNEVFKLER